MAAAEDPAPASASMEALVADAPPPPMELRMFVLDGKGGAVDVGRFDLSHPPPPPLRAHASAANKDEAEGGNPRCKEAAIYLVVLEGAEIRGIARLSFLEGRPVGGAGDNAETCTREKAEAETSTEEEAEASDEEAELETWEEEDEEMADTFEETEEEGSQEEEKSQAGKHYAVQIRMWPGFARVVVALFGGGCWELTRGYRVNWLQHNEKEEVLKIIGMGTEINAGSTQASSFWSEDSTSMLHFEGPLEYSNDLEKLICAELSASLDDFRVVELLGKGATSKVYKCVYLDGPTTEVQYAMKKMEISKDFDDIDTINNKEPREVNIMSCLEVPYAVSFYQAWIADGIYKSYLKGSSSDDEPHAIEDDLSEHTSEDDLSEHTSEDDLSEPKYVVIQMECCLRTLRDDMPFRPREINIKESWMLFEQITRAVQCIHRKGIIHRDLKPDNIFFGSNNSVKIGDFGHACWATNKIDGLIGTPNRGTKMYTAPELDEGQHVTNKADIYSMGVIFLELLYPFKTAQQKYDVLIKLRKNIYPTDWKGDSVLLKKLTSLCPSHRPSTDEILIYIAEQTKNSNAS